MKLRVPLARPIVVLALGLVLASCDDTPTDPSDPNEPPPPAPKITAIEPLSGSADGGTELTVTGEGFTDVSSVFVGETQVVGFTVESPASIKLTVPRGEPGDADVIVTTPGGSTTSSQIEQRFTRVPNALTSFTLSASAVSPGMTLRGTVATTFAAPAGGVRVPLWWDSTPAGSAAVLIPSAVTVPAGSTTGSFEITTFFASTRQEFAITASHGGAELTTRFTLSP